MDNAYMYMNETYMNVKQRYQIIAIIKYSFYTMTADNNVLLLYNKLWKLKFSLKRGLAF